jgi:Zinc-binding dehydrogenase
VRAIVVSEYGGPEVLTLAERPDTARLIQAGSAYLTRTSLVHYARGPQQLLAHATHVFGLVQSGELRIHIGGRYPLADAGSAHRELESRRSSGKLLLIPDQMPAAPLRFPRAGRRGADP